MGYHERMSNSRFNYIHYSACSDAGLHRSENEDSYACLEADGCFLISDGMGGGSAGEIASQIVEDMITESIAGSAADSPGLRKYEIQQAIHKANQKIQQYAAEHRFQQMGATLAMLLFDSWNPANACLCHIGDSRIYRFRDGILSQLTSDHTIGNELSQKSDLSFNDHKTSVLSHVLTRAIGTASNVLPEWQKTELLSGDLFMICSDGVSSMLSNNELQEIFAEYHSLDSMLQKLTAQVKQAGAKDNFTLILCEIMKDMPDMERHSEKEWLESNYLEKISEERIDRG